jgi:hypothetical protein
MDTFAPEFSRHWLSPRDGEAHSRDRQDEDARALDKALEELVERVAAARSIV